MIGVFVPWSDRTGRWANCTAGYVIDGNGCHVWVGAHNGNGYGRVGTPGSGRANDYVHRVRYEREVGPIPAGMDIDHICNNRSCCNPRHLRPVSHRENILRGNTVFSKNRAKTHCPRGHELKEGNLRLDKLKIGQRECLTCSRVNKVAANRKRRAAARQPASP